MATRDQDRLKSRFTAENPLRALVITMSDRAHAGAYEDEGGPAAESRLRSHYIRAGIPFECDSTILPDDGDALATELITAVASGVNIIVTTGGTGVGPRDITPDVVLKHADKVIPGVMEVIRVRHGLERPVTALSRTVAATMGTTLVYVLPGNPKGVEEYLTEVLKTTDHLLCVLHGIEAH